MYAKTSNTLVKFKSQTFKYLIKALHWNCMARKSCKLCYQKYPNHVIKLKTLRHIVVILREH